MQLQPYNVFIEKSFPTFITTSGLRYHVYFYENNSFIEDNPLISGYIWEFGFDFEGVCIKGNSNDLRIAPTICLITKTYLAANEDKVLYVIYDSIDNREKARKKLFTRWFRSVNVGGFEKHDFFFESEVMNIYGSIIIHKDHTFKNIVLKQLNNLRSVYSELKNA